MAVLTDRPLVNISGLEGQMKKFKIEVIGYEVVSDEYEIETDSRKEAEKIAIERFNDDHPSVDVDETEVGDIEEVK